MSKLNAVELLNCVEIDKLLPIEISTLEFFTHTEPDALPNAPTICSSLFTVKFATVVGMLPE